MPSFVPRPAEGLKYANAVQMFAARAQRSPHGAALRHRDGGAWRTLTWRGWQSAAAEVAAGLVELGVRRGDRVVLYAPTCLAWVLADLAIAMAGAVSVPIYPTSDPETVAHILKDSGCVAAIADNVDELPRAVRPEIIIRLEDLSGEPRDDGAVAWSKLRRTGADALADTNGPVAQALASAAAELGPDDEFSYVYTSGTTGVPKGVVLTHKNIVYEAWAIKNVVPVDDTDEQLLVLPLAHIFARHLVWGAVEQGAVTSIGSSADEADAVASELRDVAPTFMGGVPIMYERAYQRIRRELSGQNAVTRRAFEVALDVGRRVSVCRQRGQLPSTSLAIRHAVAQRVFFSRVQALFGGRLRFFVSGGAALSKEVAEFFHACGILILEGYGLTETTGATNVNRPDRFRFGTVGPAMPGCELRVSESGEVLVRGHNVMARYHNLPDETRAAFDQQGWFRTGDIGELADGFLRITDRIKDLFKLSTGKYVAPRVIESRLGVREGIAYAVVVGDGRPYPVALVALDPTELLRQSDREGLGCRTYADLAQHPRIRQIVQGHLDEVASSLSRHEQVRRFAIAPQPFTERTGELTPTRKVRRAEVLIRYADLVAGLYDTAPYDRAEPQRGPADPVRGVRGLDARPRRS